MKNKDSEFQKAFGKHVKKLREEKEWSQQQLAAISNIDINQISRIENGKHAANMHTIRAIAIALGKYPDELLRFPFSIKLNTDFNVLYKKDRRPKTTLIIKELSATDFLNSPKTVAHVIEYCKKTFNVDLQSPATSGALKKLVDSKILKRFSSKTKKNIFEYQKRK